MRQINKNLVGTKINELQIIKYLSKNHKQFFECICVCGEKFQARVDSIKAGTTKSCGCLKGNLISRKNRLPDNLAVINLVFKTYKDNARKRKLVFKLTFEEFNRLIFANCFYCNQAPKLVKFSGQKNRRDRFLSYNGVDRIDNNVGYVGNNCVACCSICNSAKSDLTFEEFKSWIQKLVNHNGK